MNQVYENLAQYKESTFFYSLLEAEKPNFTDFNKKDDKKGEKKDDKKDPKKMDPKKEQMQKLQVEAEKNGMATIKKMRDNFGRMKSAAGTKIVVFKDFLNRQKEALAALREKDPSIKKVYAMYDSEFLVALRNVEGKLSLVVLKINLGEGEENPFFTCNAKSVINEYKKFNKEMINDLKAVKNDYIKTVETKKKEEEAKKQKEKLDKFLKES